MKPSLDSIRLAGQYLWNCNSQNRGQVGPQLGRGAGQSTDFLDHRPYVMGDDIRRIDWNAVARTDQLLIKRFQEEIRPSITLILDDSQSMSAFPDKAQRMIDGAAWLSGSFEQAEVQKSIVALEQGTLEVGQCLEGHWEMNGIRNREESLARCAGSFRRGTHVILLTDLLSPHEPQKVLRLLRERAHHCTVIQVLSSNDVKFTIGEVIQMQDSETGEIIQLSLDASAIHQYHQRVQQIQTDWQDGLRGWGELVVFQSPDTWEQVCVELLRLDRLSLQ